MLTVRPILIVAWFFNGFDLMLTFTEMIELPCLYGYTLSKGRMCRVTLHAFIRKKCALCGAISDHAELISTSYFGSPDLDGRPPPLGRWTLDTQIQNCPSCGYCAPDISEKIDGASVVVKSSSYKKQLREPELPELADAFLCFSMIMEKVGNYAKAGLACVHAAWVCDDENNDAGARRCRVKAVALL